MVETLNLTIWDHDHSGQSFFDFSINYDMNIYGDDIKSGNANHLAHKDAVLSLEEINDVYKLAND